MGTPRLTLVGHATDHSARILCCADAPATVARLAWRTKGPAKAGSVDITLNPAPPYGIGVGDLDGLPSAATVEYAVDVAAAPGQLAKPTDILARRDLRRFRLLPVDRPLRIAFVSCNGPFQIAEEDRRYLLWRRLKKQIDDGNVDLVIHGGDQIYADPIWMRYDSDPRNSALKPTDSERVEALTSEYRQWYVERAWQSPDVANVLAAVPNVMTWDDHDIFDGWGSHDEDAEGPQQAFLKAATRAFDEFQVQHGPPRTGSSFLGGFDHNQTAVLLLDTRSNRRWTKSTVLGSSQLQDIGAWSAKHITDKTRRLFLVSSIPLVHAKVAGALVLLRLWPGQEEIQDDLRDAWTSQNNRAECQVLCKWMFSLMKRYPQLQVTVLSGDVHVAAIAEIQSRLPAHRKLGLRVFQVTSSGIGYPPPTGVAMWMIRQSLATKWMDVGSQDFQGRLIPLSGSNSNIMAARNFAVLRQEDDAGQWQRHGNLYVDLHVETAAGTDVAVHRQVLHGPA